MKNKKNIIIFGIGQLGKLAEYYFRTDSKYKVIAFVADDLYVKNKTYCKLPIVKFSELKKKYPPDKFKIFIALSYSNMNQDRASKYYLLKEMGYHLVSYISSKCVFLSERLVGENCFILENNIIQPFVKIGQNVFIWSGNHIGHDSIISDHSFISSHVVISGNVRIKEYTFIGVNATLRDNIIIAKKSLIGAGSIIMNDTSERDVYIANATSKIKKNSSEIKL